MGTIAENIQTGTILKNIPSKDIIELITSAFDAYEFMGYDYEFFSNENVNKLAFHLREHYGNFTDRELADLLTKGISGEYGKNPREIKGYTIIGWIREYQKKRDETISHMSQKDIFRDDSATWTKHPMGSAILLKMDYIPTKHWERIDTKELAIILEEQGKEAALEYCERCGANIVVRIN